MLVNINVNGKKIQQEIEPDLPLWISCVQTDVTVSSVAVRHPTVDFVRCF